jgi:hypothetical protein
MSASERSDTLFAGIRAAGLLEEACRSSETARIEVVRALALDLGRQLDALADLEAAPDVLAEAAICCADLANLAACNAPDLPPDAARRAAAATRLSAGAVDSLVPMVEAGSGDLHEEHAENLLRDARSAAWRAGFAARLVEGFPEDGSSD